VVKALCPPKVVPGLQSTGSARIPRELSGTGVKGRIVTRREERSRDRVTSGREEKPPRLRAAILSREKDPEGVGDKATRGGKRVSAEIFFERGVFYTCERG